MEPTAPSAAPSPWSHPDDIRDRLDSIPARRTAGIRTVDIGTGHSEVALDVPGWGRDDTGRMIPGLLGVLADTALGAAVASGVSPDLALVTTHLHLDVPQAVPPTSRTITCRSRLVSVDDQFAIAEGLAVSDDDVVVARMGLGSLLLDVAPRSERASVDVRNTPARAVDARLVGQGSVDRELGTELIAAAADSLTATFVARPRFANMRGMLHGGFGACFGERVLDLALAHRSEAEHGLRLADLRVTYLRGIPADDRALPCHAAVAYAGRRFATARGEVFDGDDRVAVMVEASYVSATSAAVPGPR